MTAPLSNRFDSVASAGASTGLSGLVPVVTVRAPTAQDICGPYGPFKPSQVWIDTVGNDGYILTSLSSSGGLVTANWQPIGGDAGSVTSLTGTANQITASAAVGNVTLSIPATFIAPGSIQATTTLQVGTNFSVGGLSTFAELLQVGVADINTSGSAITTIGTGGTGAVRIGNATGNTAVTGSLTASTSLTATLGNITATNGNFVKGTAGNKDVYISTASTTAAGANSAGTVVLVGGTATISSTAVTASSLIRMTRQSIGATGAAATGNLSIATIVPGTSFVINSVSAADATALAATDVSVIFWEVVN